MSIDSDILDAGRRFNSSILSDPTMNRLIGTENRMAVVFSALLKFDPETGQKTKVRFGVGTEIVKFFKRNPGLFIQLSEFILFLDDSNKCKNCGHRPWYHDPSITGAATPENDVCNNFQERELIIG